ncbi:hypothetical protein P8452_75637 [Trifolium repens]|nr:hypothetical protein P8452_75637 [Trifolium repens]
MPTLVAEESQITNIFGASGFKGKKLLTTMDVNGAGNVRRKLSPFPAPNCFRENFCLHPRLHGGIFISIPIPTDPHGSRGDPRISNINKKLYFPVKIMIVV